MRYAIIAAGEGSRLAQEGIREPKPLVSVAGERLLDRLVRIFGACEAEEIVVVCNGTMPLVANHLESLERQGLPLRHVVRTTPSSMHSLHALSPLLQGEPFVLTTVDTIFRERDFHDYVAQFRQALAEGLDGLMGVTTYIDDEKPLYVSTDASLGITGFHDACPPEDCRYISAGIYGLTPRALGTLDQCISRGEQRMRNFQRALLSDGLRLRAHSLGTVFDIDHASDIRKAEAFLKE